MSLWRDKRRVERQIRKRIGCNLSRRRTRRLVGRFGELRENYALCGELGCFAQRFPFIFEQFFDLAVVEDSFDVYVVIQSPRTPQTSITAGPEKDGAAFALIRLSEGTRRRRSSCGAIAFFFAFVF